MEWMNIVIGILIAIMFIAFLVFMYFDNKK